MVCIEIPLRLRMPRLLLMMMMFIIIRGGLVCIETTAMRHKRGG